MQLLQLPNPLQDLGRFTVQVDDSSIALIEVLPDGSLGDTLTELHFPSRFHLIWFVLATVSKICREWLGPRNHANTLDRIIYSAKLTPDEQSDLFRRPWEV